MFQFFTAHLAAEQHHAVVDDALDVVVVGHEIPVAIDRVARAERDATVPPPTTGIAAPVVGDTRADRSAAGDHEQATVQKNGSSGEQKKYSFIQLYFHGRSLVN